MKALISLCLSLIILFSGCATIFTGTKDTIRFDSTPEGATVLIDGIETCKTPCTTKVRRSLNDKSVEFRLKDYETRLITLDKTFNLVSIVNLIDIFGWAIDAVSGSLMKYDKKTYDIELDKKLSSINPQTIDIDTDKKTVDIYVVAD